MAAKRWLGHHGAVGQAAPENAILTVSPARCATPFAQWHAGAFVEKGGLRGRLVAAAEGAAKRIEIQLPSRDSGTGVAVREVALRKLRSVGPSSDAELCAWWDDAIRDARVEGEAVAKARRLPQTAAAHSK